MLDEVVREWKRFEEINESIDRIDFGLHVPRLTAGIFVPSPRCTHWLTGVAAAVATAVDRSRSVRAGIAASTAEVLAQQGSARGLLASSMLPAHTAACSRCSMQLYSS